VINDSILLRERNIDDSLKSLEYERNTYEEKRKLAISSVNNIIGNDLFSTPRTDIEVVQLQSIELQIQRKELYEEK
jgi:hypothetical protein